MKTQQEVVRDILIDIAGWPEKKITVDEVNDHIHALYPELAEMCENNTADEWFIFLEKTFLKN